MIFRVLGFTIICNFTFFLYISSLIHKKIKG